ncbi:MAG: hypothetical protein NUV77_25190, partial [Thermoguttaceae bacterium]|nr:hypothetical protein [Thermoguttaceae bacterium]
MTCIRKINATLLFVCLASSVSAIAGETTPQGILGRIMRTWIDRQARVATVEATWREERVFIGDSSAARSGRIEPPQDTTVLVPQSLCGFDNQGRLYYETDSADPTPLTIVPAGKRDRYRSGFNGTLAKMYTFPI